jgi:hypothetical protein
MRPSAVDGPRGGTVAGRRAAVQRIPTLLHPPVWPVMLARAFRADRDAADGRADHGLRLRLGLRARGGEPFLHGLSALWVWLIGRKLFDQRVGFSRPRRFWLSDLVWRQSLLGGDLGAAMFFALGAVYAALWAAEVPAGHGAGSGPGAGMALAGAAGGFGPADGGRLPDPLCRRGVALVFLYLGTSRRRPPVGQGVALRGAGRAAGGAVDGAQRVAQRAIPSAWCSTRCWPTPICSPATALARPAARDARRGRRALRGATQGDGQPARLLGRGLWVRRRRHPAGAVRRDVSSTGSCGRPAGAALVPAAGRPGDDLWRPRLRRGKPARALACSGRWRSLRLGVLPGAARPPAVRGALLRRRGGVGGDVPDGAADAAERAAAAHGPAVSAVFPPLHRLGLDHARSPRNAW